MKWIALLLVAAVALSGCQIGVSPVQYAELRWNDPATAYGLNEVAGELNFAACREPFELLRDPGIEDVAVIDHAANDVRLVYTIDPSNSSASRIYRGLGADNETLHLEYRYSGPNTTSPQEALDLAGVFLHQFTQTSAAEKEAILDELESHVGLHGWTEASTPERQGDAFGVLLYYDPIPLDLTQTFAQQEWQQDGGSIAAAGWTLHFAYQECELSPGFFQPGNNVTRIAFDEIGDIRVGLASYRDLPITEAEAREWVNQFFADFGSNVPADAEFWSQSS